MVEKKKPVSCSQCGEEFILDYEKAGGFSHCSDHAGLIQVEW